MIQLKQCKRCGLTFLPVKELEFRNKGYCTRDCQKGKLTPMQKDEKRQGLYTDDWNYNFSWM